jgi:ABC-type uncharacterized transport system permease subunit
MRLVLTALLLALLYSLLGSLWSAITLKWKVDAFIYSLVMSFFFILIPLFIAVSVFHLFLSICKWTNRHCGAITQITALFVTFNLTVLLFYLPDFIRHQTAPGYTRYNSFGDYIIDKVLEGAISATIFSIAIPIFYRFLRNKKLENKTA